MVLVSHNHGFVFLKTRKTGGASVELALEPLCRPHTRAAFRDLVTGPSYESDHDLVHLDGAFAADRVIRFETLAADLAAVRRELAPDAAPAPLPHAKRTSDRRRRPVADYYDEASIAAVRRNGAWAIDRFGYPDRPDAGENAHADPIEVQR